MSNGSQQKKWSGEVTQYSDALSLAVNLFKKDPHKIALSLKRAASKSKKRKSSPYQSAMSMLTFYINRAGKNLSRPAKKKLEKAKLELHHVFGKTGGAL